MESFENIAAYWRHSTYSLNWNCPFVLPHWLALWWDIFGSGSELFLCAVRYEDDVIGIAPLLLQSETASFIGDIDVCDYQDFIVAPERSREFFKVLLDDLNQKGIKQLDLKAVRADSTTMLELLDVAEQRGCEISRNKLDVSLELDLPATWDDYLLMLNGKQRHEVRRKLRRSQDAGNVTYRVIDNVDDLKSEMDIFIKLFKSNRKDKVIFMTEKMASFFRLLTKSMAAENMLKLYFLDVNATPVAAAICFTHNSRAYLYNSGFDARFSTLSVGLLCKVFSIRDSIQNGDEKYDFLKGAETYKYRLGGQEVPLYECRVKL